MYEVEMKYSDLFNVYKEKNQNHPINDKGYKFENITMDNFILNDLEVNNEDIALIKIK